MRRDGDGNGGPNASESRSRADARIRVLIASDVLLYREGLVELLGRVPTIDVVGAVERPHDAAEHVLVDDADVILVALGEQQTSSVRALLEAAPDARVVVVAAPDGPEDVIALAELGVLGYVTREQSLSDLTSTITTVAEDEMACAPRIAALLVRRVQQLAADRPAPVHCLTPREEGVLELLADGLSNREIASRLHIELTTVKNHVHNILEKLGARSRAEAVTLLGRSPTMASRES